MQEIEESLTGGNTNSAVVKVGNTVLRTMGRTMGRTSPSVHRLLRFLQEQGYKEVEAGCKKLKLFCEKPSLRVRSASDTNSV